MEEVFLQSTELSSRTNTRALENENGKRRQDCFT